ncbi:hypothetical protein CXB51_001856 [Gossypium anomalum]|uniref:DUF7745 domain-containing protein n=1 Tax=Gossypium anomalum TaxID=47600 RepID=A0A8J6DF91_9ROSI|nr:hypothetical protein CXB51_001856 [Gossypium anomalum]
MEESIIQTTEKNAVWDSDTRGIFTERYGDIASLIVVNINEGLIQAMIRFWDPAYQCFIFNQEYMTPTVEEYVALLRINNVQFYKIYVKEPKPMTFKKKLVKLTGLTDTWAEKQIKKKNEISCIPWFSLRDLVLNHPDILKRVNLFALSIYGLVVFPKVLGHIEVAVVDFFEKLKQGINPIPTILAETFRSLSNCRRKGEGRFIGCVQLLNVWILSHFWKVERTPFHMFSKTFAPLEAYLERKWPKDVTEEHWVLVFQNLRAEDVTWRAPWIRPSVLLYKVGNQDWVSVIALIFDPSRKVLKSIEGQHRIREKLKSRNSQPEIAQKDTGPCVRFISGLSPEGIRAGVISGLSPEGILAGVIYGLSPEGIRAGNVSGLKSRRLCAGEGYMKRVRDTAKSWKKIHLIELALYADTFTQGYDVWRKQRVNSQQVSSMNYTFQNPFSEEMPFELEMARLEFEIEKVKMSQDLTALQEENYS